MSYYPPQGTAYGQPMVMSSHHGTAMPVQYAGTSSAYYGQQPGYGGENVVYLPPGSSHHGHHHSNGYSMPQVATTAAMPAVIAVPSSSHGHRHHRRHHGSSSGGHHHRSRLTFGDRIRRFFGFGHQWKTKSSNASWGFLGRSRRRTYIDARTGGEVDRKGRPVYRV